MSLAIKNLRENVRAGFLFFFVSIKNFLISLLHHFETLQLFTN
jgi:hypothetical protein